MLSNSNNTKQRIRPYIATRNLFRGGTIAARSELRATNQFSDIVMRNSVSQTTFFNETGFQINKPELI